MDTETLMERVMAYLHIATPEARIKFFDHIFDTYCPQCGREHPSYMGMKTRCQCENDE